jgi:RNA polymerase sigma-70 factor, ECF subfamily
MPDQSAYRVLALPISNKKGATPVAPMPIEEEIIGLFDELRDSLFRYSLAFRISPHDCEDVIQEVFLALFKHLLQGGSRRNLRGWIFRVTHNLALKRCYDTRRWQQEPLDSTWAEQQADPAVNAEQQLVLNERQSRLVSVFDALPDEDRHCLRLRAEGLSYREIGGILGISLGSVSQYLTRALARLARADGR